MLRNVYLSNSLVSCFDGEPAGDDPIATAAAAAAAVSAASGGGHGTVKSFTQDEVNAIMAKEKRQYQATLTTLEASHRETLANNQNLTAKERTALEESLAAIQGQLMTKEEQAKRDKKELEDRLQNQISEARTQASTWEQRYKTESIDRALQDAAVSAEAFQPGQIVTLLKPVTKLVEDVDPRTGKSSGRFIAMVEFDDVDADGQPTIAVMTPKDAVKRMKQLPETYGNLFKSGVVSGIGANSATGVTPGSGKLDLRKLAQDPAAYRKMRSEDPGRIGLSPRRP